MSKHNWSRHPPPSNLWVHYHPNPGVWSNDHQTEIPHYKGEIWEQVFETKEHAEDNLDKNEGWQIEEYVHIAEVEKLKGHIAAAKTLLARAYGYIEIEGKSKMLDEIGAFLWPTR